VGPTFSLRKTSVVSQPRRRRGYGRNTGIRAVQEEQKSKTTNKYVVCIIVVVNILSVWGYERSEIRIRVGVRDFSLVQNVQTGSGAYPAPYSVSTGQNFCARFEVEHLLHIREFSSSSLGTETGKSDGICDFL
jgi:hypothetical protein